MSSTLNQTYVKVFAICVMKGTYTLDENETGKRLVPKKYRDAVAQWIADYVADHESHHNG